MTRGRSLKVTVRGTHGRTWFYRYMEALSASMGVCGSEGAGLDASANVPSMNFCSESLSAAAAATPGI